MTGLRPCDYNGFVPDQHPTGQNEPPSGAGQSRKGESQPGTTAEATPLTSPYDDPDLNWAWHQGAVAALIRIASLNITRMNEIIERTAA